MLPRFVAQSISGIRSLIQNGLSEKAITAHPNTFLLQYFSLFYIVLLFSSAVAAAAAAVAAMAAAALAAAAAAAAEDNFWSNLFSPEKFSTEKIWGRKLFQPKGQGTVTEIPGGASPPQSLPKSSEGGLCPPS